MGEESEPARCMEPARCSAWEKKKSRHAALHGRRKRAGTVLCCPGRRREERRSSGSGRLGDVVRRPHGVLDPHLLSSCSGPCLPSDFANSEAELRRLFDRISATLAGESSPGIPVFESLCSDLVERWVQGFLGESGAGSSCCRRFSLFPDLRRRIEALTHALLSERMASPGSSGSRKRKRGFVGMLTPRQREEGRGEAGDVRCPGRRREKAA